MVNRDMEKLSPEEMNQAAGGERRRVSERGLGCRHEHKIRTGNEKEDSFLIFWSRHKYEYYCPDCKMTLWGSG